MQGTIPPSGPMAGAQIGSGPFVGDPTMFTAPQRRTSVVPGDSLVPSQRTSYERDGQPGRSRHAPRTRIHHEIPEHDNIPMAMPVRASRSGEPLRRDVERQYDSPTSSTRGHRKKKHRDLGPVGEQVKNAVASVLGKGNAPLRTEVGHESPGSPQTDGQSDNETPTQRRKTHESPMEFMRRTQAINRVVEATQSFLGGYPDVQCLVGNVSSTNVSNTPRSLSERRARTNNL
jgi:hypothetical protein